MPWISFRSFVMFRLREEQWRGTHRVSCIDIIISVRIIVTVVVKEVIKKMSLDTKMDQ
jgi:hypothetical protein